MQKGVGVERVLGLKVLEACFPRPGSGYRCLLFGFPTLP